ncbi:hypothetical protein BH11BAC5_BH11BAC5_50090 [soil metagenome]
MDGSFMICNFYYLPTVVLLTPNGNTKETRETFFAVVANYLTAFKLSSATQIFASLFRLWSMDTANG